MDAGSAQDLSMGMAHVDAGGAGDAPIDASTVGRFSCPGGAFPTPAVQSIKNVCEGFAFNYTFNEGPTWVASQNAFFFSNYVIRSPTGGDMIKYTPGGQCEIFIRDVGCNGLAATRDGNLLAACHQSRSVVRFDLATKQPSTIVDGYMGMMFDSPNDLVIHSNGTIYFTNPDFELGGRPPGLGLAVFRIDPAGVLSMIARTPCNGIALSPDESKLYVLQAGVWDLDAQGVPSNLTNLFARGDGMAVDCAGNLYVSGTIFSAAGQRLGSYASPGGTNLAFGGADGTTLLVVGADTQVRELQMNLPGLP
jgi:gluconolactonase